MFEKLAAVEQRLLEIERLLQSSDLYEDPKRAAELLREQKELTPVVEAFRAWKGARDDLETARELAHDSDPEMRAMGAAEAEDAKARMDKLEDDIKLLLLPRDRDDDKNVIVEIRGGVGGEEAALFAAVLFRMYSMYAERRRFSIEVMNATETELGGYKEISFLVEGKGAWSRFKFESGAHRVQRVDRKSVV